MKRGGAGKPAAPLRRLVPIALAVLAVHLWLLQLQPSQLVSEAAAPVQRFVLRELSAAAPAAAGAPASQAPAPTRAPPSARPAPAPPAPPAPSAARALAEPPAAAPSPEPDAAPLVSAEQPALPQAAPTEPPGLPVNVSGVETGLDAGLLPASAAAGWRATVLPEPARIHYEVLVRASGITIEGQAQLHWRHDGSRYDARLALTGLLLPAREQRSTGRIGPSGLEPLRFSDRGRRGEQATHFVREQGKLVFSNNQPEAVLEAGAQDRLSVVVQLAVIVAGEPDKYPPGTAIAIPTAGTGDLETWIFTVEGEEELRLPGGTVRALKLQRQPRKEFDQKVEIWLAPRMDYAPVRVRLTNPNGDSVDQRWSSTDKG